MLGSLKCLFAPHTPNRRRVREVRKNVFEGYCSVCGAPIRRINRDAWVRDWTRSLPFIRSEAKQLTDQRDEQD